MSGFYLMSRGWMDNPALGGAREPYCRRAAWAWIIENTCWQDTKIDIAGKTITLRRGQLCHSYRHLADEWKWSLGAVQRFIDRLETDTMVERTAVAGRMILTVCNYERYQSPGRIGDTENGEGTNTPAIQQRYASDTKKKEGKEDTYTSPFAYAQGEAPPAASGEPELVLVGAGKPDPVPLETIKAMAGIWRDVCGDVLPVPRALDRGRVTALRARYLDTFARSLDQWREFCQRVRGSPFLTGDNDRGWKADIDFVLKPKHANKLLEGGYDAQRPSPARNTSRPARSVGCDDQSGLGGIFDAVADELDARRAAAFG